MSLAGEPVGVVGASRRRTDDESPSRSTPSCRCSWRRAHRRNLSPSASRVHAPRRRRSPSLRREPTCHRVVTPFPSKKAPTKPPPAPTPVTFAGYDGLYKRTATPEGALHRQLLVRGLRSLERRRSRNVRRATALPVRGRLRRPDLDTRRERTPPGRQRHPRPSNHPERRGHPRRHARIDHHPHRRRSAERLAPGVLSGHTRIPRGRVVAGPTCHTLATESTTAGRSLGDARLWSATEGEWSREPCFVAPGV